MPITALAKFCKLYVATIVLLSRNYDKHTNSGKYTHASTWLNIHKNLKVRAQKHIQPVSWLPVRTMNLFKDTLHQEKPDPLKLIWNNEPLQWWQAAPERFLSQMSIFLLTTLHSVSCLEFRTAPLNVKVWNNIFGRFDQNWFSVSTLSQWMEIIGNLWRFF